MDGCSDQMLRLISLTMKRYGASNDFIDESLFHFGGPESLVKSVMDFQMKYLGAVVKTALSRGETHLTAKALRSCIPMLGEFLRIYTFILPSGLHLALFVHQLVCQSVGR